MNNYLTRKTKFATVFLLVLVLYSAGSGQDASDDAAENVIKRAVNALGGQKYLDVRSQVGRGRYSVMREGKVVSFRSFIDVIVFPDKERTDLTGGGTRTVQANNGDTGWVYDGDQEALKDQNESQLASFKRGMRVSVDTLLRNYWKDEATLSYVGKRPATLGRRNDVVKLTYEDGLVVEFEIGVHDGIPVRAIHKRLSDDGTEIVEEDRYAQFIDIGGVKTPYIIDRFTGGSHTSRINFESVEFNRPINDSIFTKPSNAKEARQEPKLR